MAGASSTRAARERKGTQIAKILRGAWRANPPPPDFGEPDLEEMSSLLKASLTAALAWWKIRHSSLAQSDVSAHLRAQYVAHAIRSAHATHRVYQYVAALRAHNIEPIVFKGWAVFSHYAEAGLRPPGDVDLAVAPHDAARATKILYELGATPVDVDVHPGLSDSAHAAYIPNSSWDQVLERTRIKLVGDLPVRVLDPEDAFQVVCIHSARHSYARPIWLCDVAAMLETRPADFDWTRALSRPPYASWIAAAILLAHHLLDAKIENTPLAARRERMPQWLVRDVLGRWAQPYLIQKMVHTSILEIWRTPARWGDAVRARVPNRLEATLAHYGALNEPFLARYQMLSAVEQFWRFTRRGGVPLSE